MTEELDTFARFEIVRPYFKALRGGVVGQTIWVRALGPPVIVLKGLYAAHGKAFIDAVCAEYLAAYPNAKGDLALDLTDHDKQSCQDAYVELVNGAHEIPWDALQERGRETLCVSVGYVVVWDDGEVMSTHGDIIFRCTY